MATTFPTTTPPRRRLRGALVAAALTTCTVAGLPPAALAAAEAGRPAPCEHAEATVETAGLPQLREAITCLLRAERVRLGVGEVKRDPGLAKAAGFQAGNMVRRSFFGHVGPGGDQLADRLRAVKWIPRKGRWDAGEILAWGSGTGGTPAAFVAAWLKSPSHFAVLRDGTFSRIGVGLVQGIPTGPGSGLTAAVEFGHR